jgi:hypothetical protein
MWNERGDCCTACFVGFKFGGSRSFLVWLDALTVFGLKRTQGGRCGGQSCEARVILFQQCRGCYLYDGYSVSQCPRTGIDEFVDAIQVFFFEFSCRWSFLRSPILNFKFTPPRCEVQSDTIKTTFPILIPTSTFQRELFQVGYTDDRHRVFLQRWRWVQRTFF